MWDFPFSISFCFYIAPVSSKEFLNIQATLECEFSLKCIRDMIRTYSQMHRTDKYSQHSSVIWPVWLNGRVFVYELSGCGFDSSWSHLKFLLAWIDWARAFDFRICVAQLTVISCIKILSSPTLCGWSGAFSFMVWFWWRKV